MNRIEIYCKSTKDNLSFYVSANGEEIFLFTQRFDYPTFHRFKKGVEIGDALSPKSRRSPTLEKVCEKLPVYLKYVEQEYGIPLLQYGKGYFDARRMLREKADRAEARAEILAA